MHRWWTRRAAQQRSRCQQHGAADRADLASASAIEWASCSAGMHGVRRCQSVVRYEADLVMCVVWYVCGIELWTCSAPP